MGTLFIRCLLILLGYEWNGRNDNAEMLSFSVVFSNRRIRRKFKAVRAARGNDKC